MDEPSQLSRAYGLPNIHESPSAATQQQPFGAYDESGVQAVCLPFFFIASFLSHFPKLPFVDLCLFGSQAHRPNFN